MSASSEPSASEFARVNVHSSSTTVTSATSAAFKLTSTTTTSFIISLITKKFHDLAPGSLIITATTPTMPTHYLSFEKEPFEESRYYPPSSESPPLPTSLLKDIKDNTPPSFTLLKTLKPDELALEQRDHLTTRLTDEIIRAGGDAEAPITIKWYYKIHTSSPLDIPGDISGDEDEDWDAPLADLILDTASTAPDISTFYTDIEASLNTPHLPPSGPPLPPPPQTRARTGTLIPSRADFLTYDFLLLQSFADANLWRRTWVILTDDKLWMVSRRGNHGEGGERSRCIPLVRNTVKETGKDNPVQNGIEVHTARKCFTFRCSSKASQQMWLRSLSARIAVSSENNFIELAEIIVTEEETSRARRCNAAVKAVIDEIGVPSLGGEAWSSTGKGAETVELVRFVMSVHKFKETCRCNVSLSGPSWVMRIGVGRQWEEANEVLLEFWGDTYGVGDIFGVHENDALNKLKTEIAANVKEGLRKVRDGDKVVPPSAELFDGVITLLHTGAQLAAAARPRLPTTASRDHAFSSLHRTSATSVSASKVKSRSSTFGMAGRAASMVKTRSKSILVSAKNMNISTKSLEKRSTNSDDSGASIG